MTPVELLALCVSVLSGLASLIAITTFILNRRKERDETIAWRQRMEDKIDALEHEAVIQGKRIDSHNNYAEMFQKYGEDIAYIRGKLE